MKIFPVLLLILVFTSATTASAQLYVPVKETIPAQARLPLASVESVKGIKNADPLESGNVPNYLLALAQHTKAAPQYANLVQTVLYGGTVQPEIKMAMGLRIARIYNSPYALAHATRWLKASEKGQSLLKNLQANKNAEFSAPEKLALEYAELLTNDVNGVSDADFARVRGTFNDSQIVELTMTVCFFNHFMRVVESLNLPIESWILTGAAKTPESLAKYIPPPARVALVSDREMSLTRNIADAAKQPQTPQQGLGLGIANSQRAMMRVPDISAAWREFGFQNRSNWTIDRNIQLQISFAVSMLNGCRYCTVHQVVGLRRLGVDIKKLLAMKKDDSALTPRELTAVEFARKLTKAPSSITDADFAKVKTEFGEQGAMEVVLQTGAFAFMNRFTDGLRLPSEDEAIRIYQETYVDVSEKGTP